MNLFALLGGVFFLVSSALLIAAPPPKAPASDSAQEKYDIIKRDQIDSTDTYAIPLDDSEVEDEEELNRIENKQVFPLPQRR